MTELGQRVFSHNDRALGKKKEVTTVSGAVPQAVTIEDFDVTEDSDDERAWDSSDEEDVVDELKLDDIPLRDNEVVVSRETILEDAGEPDVRTKRAVKTDHKKARPKKPRNRVRVIREIIKVVEKPVDEKPKEPEPEPEVVKPKHVEPVKMVNLPSRIGDAREEMRKSLVVAAEDTALCPVCDLQVLREETLVRYSKCGHYAHFDCATSAIESMHINKCLTCAGEEIMESGVPVKCFDVIEGATRAVRIPDPNSDSYSVLAGHNMHPLVAMYHLKLEDDESKEASEIPVVTDEIARQVADVYGPPGACPEPLNKVDAAYFTETPGGLRGIVKNIQRGMQGIAKANMGASQYQAGAIEDRTMESMINSGIDIEKIIESGFDIQWVRTKRLPLDLFLDCQYGVHDLRKLGATRDDLVRMGLQLKHLNRMDLRALEDEFTVDMDFVFSRLARRDWKKIAEARLSSHAMAYYGMKYEWLVRVGVHPYGWQNFSYLTPKEFRDQLEFNTTVFTRHGNVAVAVIGAMKWTPEILRDVFSVESDESAHKEAPAEPYVRPYSPPREPPETEVQTQYRQQSARELETRQYQTQQNYHSQPPMTQHTPYVQTAPSYGSMRIQNSESSFHGGRAYYPPPSNNYTNNPVQYGAPPPFMSPFHS